MFKRLMVIILGLFLFACNTTEPEQNRRIPKPEEFIAKPKVYYSYYEKHKSWVEPFMKKVDPDAQPIDLMNPIIPISQIEKLVVFELFTTPRLLVVIDGTPGLKDALTQLNEKIIFVPIYVGNPTYDQYVTPEFLKDNYGLNIPNVFRANFSSEPSPHFIKEKELIANIQKAIHAK